MGHENDMPVDPRVHRINTIPLIHPHMVTERLSRFDHPAWITAVSTLIAWGIILAVVFVALFAVPYLAVTLL
ncbi:Uncharacterized protein AArcS_1985 [Natranaeroarchaeum sulfidigenes]|uniref:Uncharacterized protein n=1 Tax=Natranaeroarchaeum sulfidigenes TaxID=2784880 RepID=A0A897MYJ3_9EURY|nr:Uncharacterized protein AArcS_1985 [Natranaeroarchaeum sulfidigenes]